MTHNQAIDSKRVACDGELLSAGKDDTDPVGFARKFRCSKCGMYVYGITRVVRSKPVDDRFVEVLASAFLPNGGTDDQVEDLVRDFQMPAE